MPIKHPPQTAPIKLSSGFNLSNHMEEIERETDAASRGEQAIIRAKMNSLVDPQIIKAL
jgi:polyphosphate kinase